MNLHARTIVTTHAAESEDPLIGGLQSAGARVLHCPSIQIVPPEDFEPLRERIAHLNEYDWILFTSKNTVEAVAEVLESQLLEKRVFGDCKIAVVGKATGARLALLGLEPELVPSDYSAEGLAAALEQTGEVTGKKFLFPCSEIARDTLPNKLEELGGHVDRVVAYRTIVSTEPWPDLPGIPDAVLFASSSAVNGFMARLGRKNSKRIFKETLCLSIGKKTTGTLMEAGAKRIAQADTSDFEGLLQLAMRELAS
jgi:uroporphyrinogen-III synthase